MNKRNRNRNRYRDRNTQVRDWIVEREKERKKRLGFGGRGMRKEVSGRIKVEGYVRMNELSYYFINYIKSID